VTYVYALVDEEPGGPLGEGLAGEPLRLVACGPVSAVVGEPESRPRADRAALTGHDTAVRRLAERFGALLPARFGEWLPDESALAARLEPRAAELAEALALVRGCVQMTLRVFGEPLPESSEEKEAGGPGARYLAARRRAWERARSLPEIDPLREALRPFLRAERMERKATGLMLGTAFHLVPRPRTGDYLRVLEDTRARLGGRRVAVSGPWPPYAFGPEGAP
jgi:hypothetical protein